MPIIIDDEIYLNRIESADHIGSTPGTLGVWQSTGAKPFRSTIFQGKAYYRKADLDDYVRRDLTRPI